MKTLLGRLQIVLLALLAVSLLLSGLVGYRLVRESTRNDADQFVTDKALILAKEIRSTNLQAIDFDARDWAHDRWVPYGQTLDRQWKPRFVSRRLTTPIPVNDEVKRLASHPLGIIVHEAVGADGERYRMATAMIRRNDALIGYAQIGVRRREVLLPLWRLAGAWGLISLVTLVLAWLGSRHYLNAWKVPLATFEATAREVAAGGEATHRFVAPPDAPELAELARGFNRLLDRLASGQAAQDRFVADASHELRTPLTVLRGELEVALRRDRSGPEYRETLENCREEIQRLSRLTENLLTLARADADAPLPARELVDAATVCRTVGEQFASSAAQRSISFEVDATREVMVEGEGLALERAVANLVDNALRYTPPGETVRLVAQAAGSEALIIVSDSGPGIAPEHLPRLFDRFYRVESFRSREQGGAGLGLAIVRSQVEAHGGTVAVRSELGQGSTFEIRLPLAKANIPPPH